MTTGPGSGGRRWTDTLSGPTGRRVAVWVATGLALVCLLAGSLAVWADRQALDSEQWADTSGRLLENPAVRELAAAELVDALFAEADVQDRLAALLPPEVRPLAGPAAGLLRQGADDAALRLLESPAVQDAWREANLLAHRRLIALLDGDEEGVLSASGGDVVLDLNPLVRRLGQRIGLQAEIPEDAGTYVILRSGELGAAQDAVRAVRALSVLLLVAAAALLALALYLADGFRRRVLLVLASGLIAIGALLLVVRRVAGDIVVDDLTRPGSRDAGRAVWLIGTDLLHDLAIAVLVYGVVLLAGAWLAGPGRRATALRRRLAPAMRDHLPWVYGVVAVVILALLAFGPASSQRRLVGTLVLIALAVAGVEVLRRRILRESPSSGAHAP